MKKNMTLIELREAVKAGVNWCKHNGIEVTKAEADKIYDGAVAQFYDGHNFIDDPLPGVQSITDWLVAQFGAIKGDAVHEIEFMV